MSDPRCAYRQMIYNNLVDCIDLLEKDLFIEVRKYLEATIQMLPKDEEENKESDKPTKDDKY